MVTKHCKQKKYEIPLRSYLSDSLTGGECLNIVLVSMANVHSSISSFRKWPHGQKVPNDAGNFQKLLEDVSNL